MIYIALPILVLFIYILLTYKHLNSKKKSDLLKEFQNEEAKFKKILASHNSGDIKLKDNDLIQVKEALTILEKNIKQMS